MVTSSDNILISHEDNIPRFGMGNYQSQVTMNFIEEGQSTGEKYNQSNAQQDQLDNPFAKKYTSQVTYANRMG